MLLHCVGVNGFSAISCCFSMSLIIKSFDHIRFLSSILWCNILGQHFGTLTKSFLVLVVGLPFGPRLRNNPPDCFALRLFESLMHTKQENSIFRCRFLFWCWWWDSNPHGFPLDFESSAYTNFATPAHSNK